MKRNNRRNCLRPSPNEEAAIVQGEQERRKKIRLKQVREQERAFARKVRQNIQNKKENELKVLSDELEKQWTEKQFNEQKNLAEKYEKNLSKLGDGHTAAVVDQNTDKRDGRVLTREEKQRAIERHNQAVNELLLQKEKDQEMQRNLLEARAKAIEVEKARSAIISSLPPPQNIILDFELNQDQIVQPKKLDDFKSTHFHLQKPPVQVERMDKDIQGDARYDAKIAESRIKDIIDDNQRNQAEQVEKAFLRHKHALEKLRVEEGHKKLMDELGELERLDRQRRQEAVAKIPVKIFQPPHKRVEDAEERQRDLEQAFEDMYMLQTGYTGDLTIALEPSSHQVIIPESHQFLVPDGRTEDQPGSSIPPSRGQTVGQAVAHDIDDENDDDVDKGQGEKVEDEQKSAVPPKGEDAVKRLLLRIQKQREQTTQAQPTEKRTEKVDKSKKPPSHPPRTAGISIGPRVNVMTPLPEEEEQQHDEDVPRTLPSSHFWTPSVANGEIHEVRSLLHPHEAARQARATTIREREDEFDTIALRETTPSPAANQEELQKQERLTRQLEEQRLIQKRLEDQLKEYQTKFQQLSSEKPQAPYDGVPQRPLAPYDGGAQRTSALHDGSGERASGPYDKGTSRPMAPYAGSVPRPPAPYDVGAQRLSAPYGKSDQRPPVPYSGGADDESIKKTDGEIKGRRPPTTDLGASVEEKDEGSLLSLESGALSEEQTADEVETIETSSSASDGWSKPGRQPQQSLPAVSNLPYGRFTAQQPTTDYSTYGTTDSGYTFRKLPQERSPFAIETTGESLVRESSDSEGRLESEEFSSSSGSLDLKHAAIPTSRPFTREIDHPLPSSTSSTGITDNTRDRISSLTSQSVTGPSRKISEQTTETSYSSPFQSVTNVSSFRDPRLKAPGFVNVTQSPTATQVTPSAPKPPGGTPNYLDEYRRKWEEEKKLIENQRQLIKQKQEQQFRRMRYYQDILERHEKDSSSGVAYSVPVEDSPSRPVTGKFEGVRIPTLAFQKSQLSDKFGQDSGYVRTDDHSNNIARVNKENESVHANKQVPRLTGLRESSSSSDNNYRKSFSWTSDSSSSGRLRNQFSLAPKSSKVSQKSTSSDFSLPSSGTEYHSLPLSPDQSALSTNHDLANASRSSITTLSELNEMMSKFTSSSENDVERDNYGGIGKPVGRTSWSQYLTEENSTKRDGQTLAGTGTVTSVPSYSTQQSNVTIPRGSIQGAQATSDTGTQRWYVPPKSSTQSVGSIGLDDSVFSGSKPTTQGRNLDLVGGEPASTQLLKTLDLIQDYSSVESSMSQQKESVLSGSSLTTFNEGSSSGSHTASNVDSSNTSTSSPVHQWLRLPKASTQSIGSIREASSSDTHLKGNVQSSNTSISSPVHHWVLPAKASTQSMGSIGPLTDVPRSETQPPYPSSKINLPIQHWVLPSKESTQSMGSDRPVRKVSSSETQIGSNIPSTDASANSFPQWILPPKTSAQSIGLVALQEESASKVQSSNTSSSSSSQQWILPPKASAQSMGSVGTLGEPTSFVQSSTSGTSSPVHQWFLPPKSSTQSLGSVGHLKEVTSTETQVGSNIQSSDTSASSPVQHWILSPKATTQSVGSTRPLLEVSSHGTQVGSTVQSTNSSAVSPFQQWVIPPKASTQSLGSIGPVASSNAQATSNIQSSGSSSPVNQWFFPPKASTQTLGAASKEGSPDTSSIRHISKPSQSPEKWYLPKKTNTQSVALHESIYGDSSPERSVFIREPVSGNGPPSSDWNFPTLSTDSVQGLRPDDETDSSSTSDNVKSRLQNMGDALLQLDKLLDAPSPTPSLSSGSLETDGDTNVTSQSEHSTINSSAKMEKVNEPLQTSETSIGTENEPRESPKDSELGVDSQSDFNESISTPDSDSVSLQDAFAQRKQDFVKKSLARVVRAKEKRFEVKPRVHVKPKSAKKETKKKAKKKPSDR